MENKRKVIIVADGYTRHVVPLENILHLESRRVYTIFHLKNAPQIISCHHLGKVYNALDRSIFLRIHRSHIVNLLEIKTCELTKNGKVILSDNTQISIAQRRRTELIRHLYQLSTPMQKIKNDPRATVRINPDGSAK